MAASNDMSESNIITTHPNFVNTPNKVTSPAAEEIQKLREREKGWGGRVACVYLPAASGVMIMSHPMRRLIFMILAFKVNVCICSPYLEPLGFLLFPSLEA